MRHGRQLRRRIHARRVFGLAGPVFAGMDSGFSLLASPVFAGLGVWGLGGGASSMISTVTSSPTIPPSTTPPTGSRAVGSVAS